MGQGVKMVSVTEPEFRDALARWGSGVTVVTARAGDEPVGMTVASFSSLSLDPPLVLGVHRPQRRPRTTAWSRPRLRGPPAGVRAGGDVHGVRAARAGEVRRAPQRAGPLGIPLLAFGVARLVCAHHDALPGGDHTILVGRVISTELAGSDPLIDCNRAYDRLNGST